MIERFAGLFKKKEEPKQKVETQTTILQKKAGTFKMECAIEEDDVESSENDAPPLVGVPAPTYLKDDTWIGPAPIKSDKQLDYMEQETLIKQQQYQQNDFLESENIHEIDCFIATTENDKTNMLSSLMAKYHDVKQVIMHVTTTSYFKSMRRIGIDAVVSKNISAENDVLKIIHSDKDEISITPFEEIHVDALEIIISENSKYINRKYTIEDIPESMCLGAIIRNEECITPTYKKTLIKPGDKLLIFLNQDSISKAESLFN